MNLDKSSGRVIIFLDFDSYEVQVWMNSTRQDLIGQDVPVVVKNHDDIILAVNYTAKARGVCRGEGRRSLEKARNICPDLEEIIVPRRYETVVDTFYPWTESNNILRAIEKSLSNFNNIVTVERSNNDEIYLDVTKYAAYKACKALCDGEGIPSGVENLTQKKKKHPCFAYKNQPCVVIETETQTASHGALYSHIKEVLENYNYYYDHIPNEKLLMYGMLLADQIMRDIAKETGYICSAGVGSNKMLAKLACSENKPEGICVLTDKSLPRIFKSWDFRRIPGFGSKQGYLLTQELMRRKYGIRPRNGRFEPYFTFSDIQLLDFDEILQALCAINAGEEFKKSEELYDACRGRDEKAVKSKLYHDSLSISKSFRGHNYCRDKYELEDSIYYLGKDMRERLDYSTHELGRQMETLSVKVSMHPDDDYYGPSGFYIPYYLDTGNVDRTLFKGWFESIAKGINFHCLEYITIQARMH